MLIAIRKSKKGIQFNLFGEEISKKLTGEFFYEAQEREEINSNKYYWKKLTRLWELVGNSFALAKLKEWLKITEKNDFIIIEYKESEIKHNYVDAAQIACNDFESLLALNDANISIEAIDNIIQRKPEYITLALKTINNRFDILSGIEEEKLFSWIKGNIQNPLIPVDEKARLISNSCIHFSKHFIHRIPHELFTGLDDIFSYLLQYSGFYLINFQALRYLPRPFSVNFGKIQKELIQSMGIYLDNVKLTIGHLR